MQISIDVELVQHSHEFFRGRRHESRSPPRKTLTDRTQAATDRPTSAPLGLKSTPLGLKSALSMQKSTLPLDDTASPHCKTTRSRRKIAPHRFKSTKGHREASPSRIHLASIEAQDAACWRPNFLHHVKSARVRRERHTYGADAADDQVKRSQDDPKRARDDMKTTPPERVRSAALPAGAPPEDEARREPLRVAR